MTKQKRGMSLIVQTATRLSVGFVLLYGINIFVKGNVSCGGGFVGGVIIALTFINIMLAYGKSVSLQKLPTLVSLFFSARGILLLFSLVLLSFVVGYLFLDIISKGDPFSLYNTGMISFNPIEIALKAGTGVFAIFFVVLLLRYKRKNDDGGALL
jgi:multicomponent Na+:H+ antiporter subunit B